ncbi:flavin reductase family protein [Chengkuizengella axinellae]|uniref:Flavin reductase family protein n=1 Tax=Chengkuizengella axinellae TaxID=3064388 RepID=A0ABT9IVA2_9BACL|nr:flavin reductase family protein [Chengkuizengella sp. 2205SS18-9]MDP5273276.1 flavin reductase family protein [Chengkuizengella sp. 2205SS18-9]
MKSINPSAQSRTENYKLLIGSIVPRPIAFVTSHNEEGLVNAAPFSFFNAITAKPPLISISIGRKEGEVKDTAYNIINNKEFVVHIVDNSFIKQVNQTSADYPSNVSEIKETGLKLVESTKVKVSGIQEAKIRMECKLHQAITIGDDNQPTCDLIIGEVVMFHIDEDCYAQGKIHIDNLEPVSRLGGADYSKIGETFTIPRPEMK